MIYMICILSYNCCQSGVLMCVLSVYCVYVLYIQYGLCVHSSCVLLCVCIHSVVWCFVAVYIQIFFVSRVVLVIVMLSGSRMVLSMSCNWVNE